MISFSCKLRETLTAAVSSLSGSFPVDWLSGFARRIRTLHTSAFTVHSDLAGAVIGTSEDLQGGCPSIGLREACIRSLRRKPPLIKLLPPVAVQTQPDTSIRAVDMVQSIVALAGENGMPRGVLFEAVSIWRSEVRPAVENKIFTLAQVSETPADRHHARLVKLEPVSPVDRLCYHVTTKTTCHAIERLTL